MCPCPAGYQSALGLDYQAKGWGCLGESCRSHGVRKPSLPLSEARCVSWFVCAQCGEGAMYMWVSMCTDVHNITGYAEAVEV